MRVCGVCEPAAMQLKMTHSVVFLTCFYNHRPGGSTLAQENTRSSLNCSDVSRHPGRGIASLSALEAAGATISHELNSERVCLGEQRDGVRDVVRRDERHDADHRKAAVSDKETSGSERQGGKVARTDETALGVPGASIVGSSARSSPRRLAAPGRSTRRLLHAIHDDDTRTSFSEPARRIARAGAKAVRRAEAHPFLSSAVRLRASVSCERLLVKPSGSQRSGILPGVPPIM